MFAHYMAGQSVLLNIEQALTTWSATHLFYSMEQDLRKCETPLETLQHEKTTRMVPILNRFFRREKPPISLEEALIQPELRSDFITMLRNFAEFSDSEDAKFMLTKMLYLEEQLKDIKAPLNTTGTPIEVLDITQETKSEMILRIREILQTPYPQFTEDLPSFDEAHES